MSELPKSFEKKMKGSLESLERDLSSIRTEGYMQICLICLKLKFTTGNAYKTPWSISTPDPQTLSLQVWDQSNVKVIEKSIRESDLNLNLIG